MWAFNGKTKVIDIRNNLLSIFTLLKLIFRKLNKPTNCHLSIVDFKRQAALLPEPQNHVHHASLTSVTSQISSSMSSTDSYENSSVTNSPGVSHRASLAMGIANGISIQSKNSQLNIRDYFFNVSNKSTGKWHTIY